VPHHYAQTVEAITLLKMVYKMGCKTIAAKTAADSLELPPVLLFTDCKRKKKCSITSDVWWQAKVSELVLKKWASAYQQASLGDTR
jgi:hypothetical protein